MDCPHIPELSYSEFGQKLRVQAKRQRIPVSGSIELNFRCNVRCAHCWVSHGHNGIPGKNELTTQEITNLFDQIADEGCLYLLLTGGEPLIRRDFLDIYTSAKQHGFITTLFTNGTLLTPRIADYLAEWRPHLVEITLYGRTQATYESITGISGSHAKCMRGIELLLERKINLKLKTMLMAQNKHEFLDIRAYAESLGTGFRYDPMINAGLDCSGKPTRYRLTPDEIVQFEVSNPARLQEWHNFLKRQNAIHMDMDHLYACGAGQTVFHIDPYGNLSVCMMDRKQQYELTKGSFRTGWREFIYNLRQQRNTVDNSCHHCAVRNLCNQCPGWSVVEHGNQWEPVNFLCQVTHKRVEAMGHI